MWIGGTFAKSSVCGRTCDAASVWGGGSRSQAHRLGFSARGVCVGSGEWTVVHANERCRAVVGVADVGDALVGRDFWSVFTPRGGDGGRRAAAADAAQQRGFDADVSVYTGSGRKHWITASFRCGGAEQLDGHCATVGFPIDVPSEPGAHQGVWFVTLRPMEAAAEALLEELRPAEAAWDAAVDGAAQLLECLPAHVSLSREQLQVRRPWLQCLCDLDSTLPGACLWLKVRLTPP